MPREHEKMPQATGKSENAQMPFAGKGCPTCGYDLTGTTETRCPECGKAFDPATLKPVKLWRRLPWWLTITCVSLAIYLPNTWVFWIDYPWGTYRGIWVKAFPVLPGLYASVWISFLTGLDKLLQEYAFFGVAGLFTLMFLVFGVLLGRRGKKWLIPICVLLFAFEVFNAYVSHALFRM